MNKLKRLAAVISAAALSITSFSAFSADVLADDETTTEAETVNADDYEVYNDLLTYYVNDDNTITIVSCYDTDEDDNDLSYAEVPEKIDGKTVVEIGEDCFNSLTALVQVVLPDTVETISNEAFYGCTTLASVNFPENLKTIGENAFYQCEALEFGELPDSIEEIGTQAFYDCQKLEEVTIPASCKTMGDYVFEGCTSLKNIYVDEVNENYCSDEGVLYDKELTTLIKYPEKHEGENYVLPDTATTVSDWAFVGCTKVVTIDLNNVTSIGEDAFYYCTELTSVEMSDDITEFVGATFGYCVKLEDFELPSNLQKIGDYCFYCCLSLNNMTISDKVESIGNYAFFYCSNLKEITVPENVSELGLFCFGYTFDSNNEEEVPVDGFKLNCVDGSAAYKYAVDNDIIAGKNPFRQYIKAGDFKIYIWVIVLIGLILVGAAVVVILVIRHKKKEEKRKQENIRKYEERKAAQRKRLERQKQANLIKDTEKKKKE